jgi:hypothetical protein
VLVKAKLFYKQDLINGLLEIQKLNSITWRGRHLFSSLCGDVIHDKFIYMICKADAGFGGYGLCSGLPKAR